MPENDERGTENAPLARPTGGTPETRRAPTRMSGEEGAAKDPSSPSAPRPAIAAEGPQIGVEMGSAVTSQAPPSLRAPRRRRIQEKLIGGILFLATAISVLTTIGIIAVLVVESGAFFAEVGVWEFLSGRRWAPLFVPQSFGVLPLLAGSFIVAIGAGIVALPIGLASAIFLSEYASPRLRGILKPTLEVLAGIPTVVYGFFALTFITPILQRIWPETQVFNALSASLVVGVMIIPVVASLSEDAMSAVPSSLREGAYALGATKLEVSLRTVLPAALSGVVASFILAMSRAIGETMIVAIAAGATPNLTLNPLESVQTMTAYIVQVSMGELAFGTVEYQTIFAVGLTLFMITLIMNVASIFFLRRFREVYE